jgi:hypothetical protein
MATLAILALFLLWAFLGDFDLLGEEVVFLGDTRYPEESLTRGVSFLEQTRTLFEGL